MNILTKLELKKIFNKKAVKVSCGLCIILVVYATIAGISAAEYEMPNDSDKSTSYVHGLEAIKLKKEAVEKYSGYLDEKKLLDIKNYNDKIKFDPVHLKDGQFSDYAYAKYCQPYDDISFLIMDSYADQSGYNLNIDNLEADSLKSFYRNRTKLIEDVINTKYSEMNFSEKEIRNIKTYISDLKTPLYYEYFDGWDMVMSDFFEFNVAFILIICFCITFVYMMDYQNSMIGIVLSTLNGKKVLCMAKIKANIIFASLVFVIANILHAVLLLSFYGFSGWNCPIQLSGGYWLSIYNIKFYQLYILGIAAGLAVCIFMTLVTILLANIFKKSIMTITFTAVIFLIPALIDTANTPKGLGSLVDLCPVKVLDVLSAVKHPHLSSFVSMPKGFIYYWILIIGSIILIPGICTLYKRQEA